MKEMIKRLGFEVWCDNQVINILEDFCGTESGTITVENDGCTMIAKITIDEISVSIRACTDEGWKNYEKTIKR